MLPAIVLLYLAFSAQTTAVKILAYPYGHCYNSHLLQMERLAGMISQNGHSVKMLINSDYEKPSFRGSVDLRRVDPIQFPAPKLVTWCDFRTIESVTMDVMKVIKSFMNTAHANCENILKDNATMQMLKEENFDMMILDALDVCGLILVNYLDIPYISYASQGLSSYSDMDAPTPLAYIPSMLSESTHDMTFLERVQNIFFFAFQNFHLYYTIYQYQNLQQKYLDLPRHVYEAYKRPSIKLIPGKFPFDYPKPVMPDMVMIGDFFINKPQPLPADLEDFMSSAEEGVVVLSFGTIVREYSEKYADMFATALGRLRQKVIWRFVGDPPATLQNNTKLMSWIPQADILAHPKTRLFITHCGRGSSYEAAYHGVPVVAIPLFADQPNQAARITKHLRMGVKVDIRTMTAEKLFQAVETVLNQPKYEANAGKISFLLQNQPQQQSDQDKILSWIHYIGTNKGANPFKSHSVHMTWYQLMMLDVFLFIFIVCISCVFLARKAYFLLRRRLNISIFFKEKLA